MRRPGSLCPNKGKKRLLWLQCSAHDDNTNLSSTNVTQVELAPNRWLSKFLLDEVLIFGKYTYASIDFSQHILPMGEP